MAQGLTQRSIPGIPAPTAAGQILAAKADGTLAWQNTALSVSPWTALTPGTGSALAASDPAQYRLVGDVVQLRGGLTVSASNGAVLATLPAGFRPAIAEGYQAASSSGKIIALNLTTTGAIFGYTNNGTAFASETVWLTPVSFSILT